MRFQGGGVGHKATHDWDELLACDPGSAVEDEASNEENVKDMEGQDNSDSDLGTEWETVMEVGEDGSDDGNGEQGTSGNIEDEGDQVVTGDKGEGLDVYGQEGYGAL